MVRDDKPRLGVALALAGTVVLGCESGGEVPFSIGLNWTSDTQQGPLSSPSPGTNERLIIAGSSQSNGFVASLDTRSGQNFDAGRDALGTPFPPIEVGDGIFVVSAGGRIERYTLDSQASLPVQTALGLTTPLLALEDGVAIGTTSQRVLRFDSAGTLVFEQTLNGSVVGQLAVDSSGRVYAYTDLGVLVRVTAQGVEPLGGVGPVAAVGLSVSGERAALAGGSSVEVRNLSGETMGTVDINEVQGVTSSGPVGLAWNRGGSIVSFAMSNGTVVWAQSLGSEIQGAPLFVDGGRFAVVLQNGAAFTLDSNGQILAQSTVPEPTANPAVDGFGQVFVVSDDSVSAFDFTVDNR